MQPPNKDFIASIKASHFDVGYPRTKSILETKRHYLSEANLNFNNKGNASELRSKLDEIKKNDLRKNHFDIGGRTAAFKHPTSQLAFRPSTALERENARPQLNSEKKADLRRSHWFVGQSQPQPFGSIAEPQPLGSISERRNNLTRNTQS